MNASQNHSSCGMILVTTLILLGIITALVIQAQITARLALNRAEKKALRVQLRAAATDAAWNALHVLASDSDTYLDHTNELWAYPVEQLLPNGIETVVRITDENRFFDVNNLSAVPTGKTSRLPSFIVRDLLASCGQSDAELQTLKLKDWIDSEHKNTRPLTARSSMESPSELARVLDVTLSSTQIPTVLTIVPARSTTYSVVDGPARSTRILPVNINTAGREVLLAVFGSREYTMVDSICRLRDSHPLRSLAPLARLMDKNRLRQYRCYLDVKSGVFSVSAHANKKGHSETTYGLVRRDLKGEIEILRWVCR